MIQFVSMKIRKDRLLTAQLQEADTLCASDGCVNDHFENQAVYRQLRCLTSPRLFSAVYEITSNASFENSNYSFEERLPYSQPDL